MRKRLKICLDAGHFGKSNRSPGVAAYYESEMAWKLHLMLKKELEAYGFEVITTRSNQANDLSLWNRGQKAAGCDLFLSLHSNAASVESVDYPLGIALAKDDRSTADEVSAALAEKLVKAMYEVMKTTQQGKVITKKADFDRNKNGILDDEYYGVLHSAKQLKVPAIILEHSFHTNTKMATWLLKDENLRALAKAEAETIANYYAIKATAQPAGKTSIMGKAVATVGQMALYCLTKNAAPKFTEGLGILEVAKIYLEEGAIEGVRGDIAFAQSCLETAHFNFGGDVKEHQNNFAGIGAVGNGASGNSFGSVRLGIRAQIQHLKAYASKNALNGQCVDPRFKWVKKGSAPCVEWLGIQENPSHSGWASGKDYGPKILAILNEILKTEVKKMKNKHWAEEALDNLAKKGIIKDTEYHRTRLNEPMTRGEVIAMLDRLTDK